jgi:hypothetical protein
VDAFLDFDQSNGKSVMFVTDRAYQPGEQVRVVDLQVLHYLLICCYPLVFLKKLLLFQCHERVGNKFNFGLKRVSVYYNQKM